MRREISNEVYKEAHWIYFSSQAFCVFGSQKSGYNIPMNKNNWSINANKLNKC